MRDPAVRKTEYFASLSKSFGNDFRIDIWSVVRVVEGAALEIFFAKRKSIFRKPFNRAGFRHLPVTALP